MNYPQLEKIIVNNNSYQDINLLKICNNNKLKSIQVEGSSDWGEGAFLKLMESILH